MIWLIKSIVGYLACSGGDALAIVRLQFPIVQVVWVKYMRWLSVTFLVIVADEVLLRR